MEYVQQWEDMLISLRKDPGFYCPDKPFSEFEYNEGRGKYLIYAF